jgi:hypothetical protein
VPVQAGEGAEVDHGVRVSVGEAHQTSLLLLPHDNIRALEDAWPIADTYSLPYMPLLSQLC